MLTHESTILLDYIRCRRVIVLTFACAHRKLAKRLLETFAAEPRSGVCVENFSLGTASCFRLQMLTISAKMDRKKRMMGLGGKPELFKPFEPSVRSFSRVQRRGERLLARYFDRAAY